jgi:hypothetical protein
MHGICMARTTRKLPPGQSIGDPKEVAEFAQAFRGSDRGVLSAIQRALTPSKKKPRKKPAQDKRADSDLGAAISRSAVRAQEQMRTGRFQREVVRGKRPVRGR